MNSKEMILMTQIYSKSHILKVALLSILLVLVFQDVDAKEPKEKREKAIITESLTCNSAALQPVRGFVVDEFGEPMVGVEVNALGSSKSTITNTEGKYHLLANNNDVLKFSQIGAIAKEEKITSSRIVNVELAIE